MCWGKWYGEGRENGQTLKQKSRIAILEKEANRKHKEGEGGTMQKSSRLVQNDQAKTNELFVRI